VAKKFETELTDKVPRTADCVSFRFARPPGFDYVAGQFLFITLPSDASLRKPFSFSSSPTEDLLEFTTHLSGSDFKKALDGLPLGAIVTIEAPYGQFTLREGVGKIAFLSGGIGITPIRSIAKYVVDTGQGVDMVLLYSNRDVTAVAFRDDLDAMSAAGRTLRVVHCIGDAPNDWTGYRGRITKEIVQAEVADYVERFFYICGPPAMVAAMRGLLGELDVDAERIVVESFAGY